MVVKGIIVFSGNVYKYLLANQIFTAIIGGIAVHYLWHYIESERNRYNNLVGIQRVSSENYNLLTNNRAIINIVYCDDHLCLKNVILHNIFPFDKDKLNTVKYSGLSGDLSAVELKVLSYNELINEFRGFTNTLRWKILDEIEEKTDPVRHFLECNKSVLNNLDSIQQETKEIICLLQPILAKTATLIKEDKPLIIKFVDFKTRLFKRGKEVRDINYMNSLEAALKCVDDRAIKIEVSEGFKKKEPGQELIMIGYDRNNSECKKCKKVGVCKKYFKSEDKHYATTTKIN